MAGSVFDSSIYAHLFPTGEVGRLFTDTAETRAMLLVEGALAKAQGEQGIIPEESAAFIGRSTMELQVDPAALAKATGQNGVSVPALIAAFRTLMQAPEHAQYVHWGATSQDIMDTGLMLRLRQALTLIETDLVRVVRGLGTLAQTHADLPMAARTYGQHATPTSFGAVVASWGGPMLGLLAELPGLRRDCLLVSLSGASGTASALGVNAAETRSKLAAGLGLNDPDRSWHTDRAPVLRLADWMTRLTIALAKIGEDITDLVQSDVSEISLGGAGASSTMPQKQNPVGPSALVALSHQAVGQFNILQSAATHRHQRDGAAWFTEWMCLPQIVLSAASAIKISGPLCQSLSPNPDRMLATLNDGLDMIHAEALSFALAALMPRPEAQLVVKSLCMTAQSTGTPLRDLVTQDWPALDATTLFDAHRQMGQAPAEARAFAARTDRLPAPSA